MLRLSHSLKSLLFCAKISGFPLRGSVGQSLNFFNLTSYCFSVSPPFTCSIYFTSSMCWIFFHCDHLYSHVWILGETQVLTPCGMSSFNWAAFAICSGLQLASMHTQHIWKCHPPLLFCYYGRRGCCIVADKKRLLTTWNNLVLILKLHLVNVCVGVDSCTVIKMKGKWWLTESERESCNWSIW